VHASFLSGFAVIVSLQHDVTLVRVISVRS
jgi:hypothetical protein